MLIRINKQTIYFGVIIFLLYFFSTQKFFAYKYFLGPVSSYIIYPIIKFQGKISGAIERYASKKKSIEMLNEKLNELQKEKDELMYDNVRLKASLGYLEQISELIEFKKNINLDSLIVSQIIHKQISDIGHFAFIDKGSQHGVEKDMVAVYKGCLLARVCDVYPTYSKIVYVTDSSCKIAAYCFKTGAVGIYEGANNLESASLNYVNHLQTLEVDDLIISSGEGLIFPQGFALGKVKNFLRNQVQYNVNVNPIIDIKKIKYCHLIKK